MKQLKFIILIAFFGCNQHQSPSSKEILESSFQKHDPSHNLNELSFNLRVQEPRLGNPERFSEVILDNKTGTFELQRNRETNLSKHIIDKNGAAKTLLNDSLVTDTSLIKKYRLEPRRNFIYRRYYQSFSLLPMSLQNKKYHLDESVEEVVFNRQKAFKISLELEEPIFSKHWNMFFSKEDFHFLGVEIIFPEDATKGERVYFDGNITIDSVSFARYHHWHELNGIYLGSDIFVKELE